MSDSSTIVDKMDNQKSLLHFDRETRFVILFILVLAVSFSPSKPLGQFVAVICLVSLIFFVQARSTRNLFRYSVIFIMYSLAGFVNYFIQPEFSLINYYMFFVTISSVLILFYDFGNILNSRLLNRLYSVTLAFSFFEALYGIAQGIVEAGRAGTFDVSTGDNVRGTIEPSFTAAGLGGNVIFAILISSLLVFILSTSRLRFTRSRIFLYTTILISWVIASVLHTILFFGVATILAILLVKIPSRRLGPLRRIFKFRNSVAVVIIFLGVLIQVFLPRNLRTAPNFLSHTLNIREDAYSEKARAIYFTLFRLSEEWPFQPLVGIGFGQYSSRASLIMTGEYLQGSSIPLPPYKSSATEVIMSLWYSSLNRPGQGSSYFPFSSWISLYGEAGIIGVLIIVCFTFFTALKLRRWYSEEFPGLNLGLMILLFYILFLGFQDNYWEYTQGVFPAFLTFAIGFNYLRAENRARRLRYQVNTVGTTSLNAFNE